MLHRLLAVLSICTVSSLFAPSLCAQSEEFGQWKSIFNGKDLSGWVNAKHAAKENSKWAVKDGVLFMPGGGGKDICTVDEFTNYELEVEYKVPKGGNSGVYLRGTTEVQVHDSKNEKELKNNIAGAIYAKFSPRKNTSKAAGEWNSFRILHLGPRITVWHNGTLIQDNTYYDGVTGGAMGKFPPSGRALKGKKGPIMLQGDHGPVWYRNLRIRSLFGEGWKPIFNGKDLSAFTANNNPKRRTDCSGKSRTTPSATRSMATRVTTFGRRNPSGTFWCTTRTAPTRRTREGIAASTCEISGRFRSSQSSGSARSTKTARSTRRNPWMSSPGIPIPRRGITWT